MILQPGYLKQSSYNKITSPNSFYVVHDINWWQWHKGQLAEPNSSLSSKL